MSPSYSRPSSARVFPRVFLLAIIALAVSLLLAPLPASAAPPDEILPLSQVRPGMQGYAYTIFAGDQVEKFDLEVIGVMPNFLGPKQSIILVQLKGPKVEHTGVVAGMSGSPVYLEGKLAGALSLRLGIFAKEPIAGVTPIEDILHPPSAAVGVAPSIPSPSAPLSPDITQRAGLSESARLQPIETPLVFSGFQPSTLRQFAPQIEGYGLMATQGGTTPARPDDAKLSPGDMAGMVLVQGDASINSACTVTAIQGDRVFLCGHPFLNLGSVQMPMARSRVLTTLSSEMASTKIVNVGGSIGTISEDHLTAVVGKLGAPPPMVPLDLTLSNSVGEKKLHFDLMRHPKLTPLLVGITTFNGLTQNNVYTEGTTLRLAGEIGIRGHSAVRFDNSFAPVDAFVPDAVFVATTVQSVFARIFSNTYEEAAIERIALRVESIPERRSMTIEGAWLEKGEALPGETLRVKVLLRPYRGAPRLVEVPMTIPEQATHGTPLRVLIGDANWMNRSSRGFFFGPEPGAGGLEQLIALINKERRNDHLYVGLFAPSPTLLVEDKELPSVPLSEMNVLDGRHPPSNIQVLRESLTGEWSVPMQAVVSGAISLSIAIK